MTGTIPTKFASVAKMLVKRQATNCKTASSSLLRHVRTVQLIITVHLVGKDKIPTQFFGGKLRVISGNPCTICVTVSRNHSLTIEVLFNGRKSICGNIDR